MKLYREDATGLRALPLQGLRRAHLKVTGPVNLGVVLHPRVALVVWWWRGRHYHRSVRRVCLRGTARLVWLCPTCGRQCRVVLFHPPNIVGCCKCLEVRYRQWRRARHQREPKSPHLWVKWFERRYRVKGGEAVGGSEDGT